MNFLDKLFKKNRQQVSTIHACNSLEFDDSNYSTMDVASASDTFQVIINTDKNLSEDEKFAIVSIVKEGFASNCYMSDICIKIMMFTGFYTPIIINDIENGVEIIF